MKEKVIPKMRISLKQFVVAKDRPPAVLAAQQNSLQAVAELRCDFVDGHIAAGSGRAFDFEVITVVVMKFLQGFDDQEVQREPNGPSPIRIAPEKARRRFRLLVINSHGSPFQRNV